MCRRPIPAQPQIVIRKFCTIFFPHGMVYFRVKLQSVKWERIGADFPEGSNGYTSVVPKISNSSGSALMVSLWLIIPANEATHPAAARLPELFQLSAAIFPFSLFSTNPPKDLAVVGHHSTLRVQVPFRQCFYIMVGHRFVYRERRAGKNNAF